jgi:hypothetical protein
MTHGQIAVGFNFFILHDCRYGLCLAGFAVEGDGIVPLSWRCVLAPSFGTVLGDSGILLDYFFQQGFHSSG